MKTPFSLGLIWLSSSILLVSAAETGTDKTMMTEAKKPMTEAMEGEKKPMAEMADTGMKKTAEAKPDDTATKEKEDNTVTITPF